MDLNGDHAQGIIHLGLLSLKVQWKEYHHEEMIKHRPKYKEDSQSEKEIKQVGCDQLFKCRKKSRVGTEALGH